MASKIEAVRRNIGAWLAVSGLSLGLGSAGTALAQAECVSDVDCAHGYTCQSGSPLVQCMVPMCDDADGNCPEPACDVPEQVGRCEPVSNCEIDSDCADGFVCHTETLETCTMPTAPCDGQDCDAPMGEVDCMAWQESACVPRASLPCEVDSECGDGFECVQTQTCACAGSTGSAGTMGEPQDAGVGIEEPGVMGSGGVQAMPAPLLPPDWVPSDAGGVGEDGGHPMLDCGCEPSGNYQCVVIPADCESDDDCVAGTTCELDYSEAVCTGGVSPLPAMDAGPAQGELPTDCEAPKLRCLALPYGFAGEEREAHSGSTGSAVAQGALDGGIPQPATGPTDLALDEESGGSAIAGRTSLGCSVANPAAGGSALALVGLALGWVRRRRNPQP